MMMEWKFFYLLLVTSADIHDMDQKQAVGGQDQTPLMINWPARLAARVSLITSTIGLLTVLTSRMYTNEHGKADIFHPWYAQHTSTLRVVYTLATIETVILTITGRSFTAAADQGAQEASAQEASAQEASAQEASAQEASAQEASAQTNYTPIPQVLVLSVLAIALGAGANSTHDWDTDNVHHAGIFMLTVGLSSVQIICAWLWSRTTNTYQTNWINWKPTVAVTFYAALHLIVLASANSKQKSALVATGICTLVINAMITWGIPTYGIASTALLNLIVAVVYTTKTVIIAMATVGLILPVGVILYRLYRPHKRGNFKPVSEGQALLEPPGSASKNPLTKPDWANKGTPRQIQMEVVALKL
jgi:hypothetical protein